MPRSAIATGLVDYVLPPAEMPAQLMAYAAPCLRQQPRSRRAPRAPGENALKKIFVLLRGQTGHDFSQYKQSTIFRRVERRMAVHQIERSGRLRPVPAAEPGRGGGAVPRPADRRHQFLPRPGGLCSAGGAGHPALFAGKPVGSTGAGLGARLLHRRGGLFDRHPAPGAHGGLKQTLQGAGLCHRPRPPGHRQARAGIYPASIAADVSPERLARFFIQEADGSAYRVHKGIRDLLIFSEHDVIKDPPFSKLDLISCRNLLIYLGGDCRRS